MPQDQAAALHTPAAHPPAPPQAAPAVPSQAAAAVPLAHAAALPTHGANLQAYHPESRLGIGHFSSRIGQYRSGQTKFRNCFVCTARVTCLPAVAKRRQTPNWCSKCSKTLCMDKLAWGKNVSCFQLFHSAKDFKH